MPTMKYPFKEILDRFNLSLFYLHGLLSALGCGLCLTCA